MEILPVAAAAGAVMYVLYICIFVDYFIVMFFVILIILVKLNAAVFAVDLN